MTQQQLAGFYRERVAFSEKGGPRGTTFVLVV